MAPREAAILRKGKTKRGLNLQRVINLMATGMQIIDTARNGTKACDHCQKGRGPFAECVVVEGFAAGACGNCHWNSEGSRCDSHPSKANAPAGTPAKKSRKHKVETPATVEKPARKKRPKRHAEEPAEQPANPHVGGYSAVPFAAAAPFYMTIPISRNTTAAEFRRMAGAYTHAAAQCMEFADMVEQAGEHGGQ
ncbi:hypothetical protein FJTKL_02131 [Diaporthe vaccinii]|uniref:Uncharacterized protein n=1 Tax=Diaporthe vaccinii TaxID=105482 RepID=A0ABR4DYX0_9PEZI